MTGAYCRMRGGCRESTVFEDPRGKRLIDKPNYSLTSSTAAADTNSARTLSPTFR